MNQAKFKKKNKACFFDRDGVLNKDIGYLYKKEDFQWIEGAVECINLLKKMKYKVIVITNQSGISRGFYNHEDVEKLHLWINTQLKRTINASIDQFYYSDEMPNNKINSRRKPSPNMIIEAFQDHNLDPKQCFLIGDKKTDMDAAKNAKIKGFLFEGGNLLVNIEKILKVLNF
jgi:D-glycero-D-manno-heptose 1,7-bisphosphate phosphatase